jgi:hypothetical protein
MTYTETILNLSTSLIQHFYYNTNVVNYNMRKIQLSQGKFALVDDEDFEWLNQWKWCVANYRGYFYAVRSFTENGTNKQVKMHGMVLNVSNPRVFVDHKNLDTLDNRKTNLRKANASQNSANRSAKKKGVSKYLGVAWMKGREKWTVWIKKDGSKKFLGYFKDEKEAANTYNKAAIELHGEFARLNTI